MSISPEEARKQLVWIKKVELLFAFLPLIFLQAGESNFPPNGTHLVLGWSGREGRRVLRQWRRRV